MFRQNLSSTYLVAAQEQFGWCCCICFAAIRAIMVDVLSLLCFLMGVGWVLAVCWWFCGEMRRRDTSHQRFWVSRTPAGCSALQRALNSKSLLIGLEVALWQLGRLTTASPSQKVREWFEKFRPNDSKEQYLKLFPIIHFDLILESVEWLKNHPEPEKNQKRG